MPTLLRRGVFARFGDAPGLRAPRFVALTREEYNRIEGRLKGFSLALRRWLPVALWALLVLYASTNVGSSSNTGAALHPFLRWFFPDLPQLQASEVNLVIRKTAHAIQFFILALLLWRAARIKPALAFSNTGLAVWVLSICAVVAALSEGIQIFMPVRGASVADFLLDVGGALFGLLAILLWRVFQTSLRKETIES